MFLWQSASSSTTSEHWSGNGRKKVVETRSGRNFTPFSDAVSVEVGNLRPHCCDQHRDDMEIEPHTVQRAIHGDQAAMRVLWTRHAPQIDVVIRRLVGQNADLAADIAQDVWIQIFRALSTFRGDSQFGTWAHRIAVNRTLNALRRERRIAAMEVEVEDDSASVEPEADRALLASSITDAASRLSPGARTVFLLHDVEGYTHEEIAAQLGITSGGSKSQLSKARAKLRVMLAHLVDISPATPHHELARESLAHSSAEHAAPTY